MCRFGFATNTGLDAFTEAAVARYQELLLDETYQDVEAAIRKDDFSRVRPRAQSAHRARMRA